MMKVEFICPRCRRGLKRSETYYECKGCQKQFPIIDEKIVSFCENENDLEKQFYDEWWEAKRTRKLTFLARHRKVAEKKFLGPLVKTEQELSFRYIGQRLLRSAVQTLCSANGTALDVACETGSPVLDKYFRGSIIGLDLNLYALRMASRTTGYQQFLHCSALATPFQDETLDYIFSTNFVGHVPTEQKDIWYKELYRVMKVGGIMAHVAETDSVSFVFAFAHKYPDLFQKYFVEMAGGHYGLELPSTTCERIERHGFTPLRIVPIYGPIVTIEKDILVSFDNEYLHYSQLLRAIMPICRLLVHTELARLAEVALTPIDWLARRFTRFDAARGLLVAYQKQ